MSIALEISCLTVAVTMPSAAEFSVFIGVGGWVKPISWSSILRGTTACPLWNIPPTSTLAAELYIFIGVGGWVKPSLWSVILRGTAVCLLWNSPPTSALAADATTCFRIMHSVWIGPCAGGRRFGDFFGSVGSELR